MTEGTVLTRARDLTARLGTEVRTGYGGAIGRSIEDVVTPALLLDIDAAQRNIDHMAARLRLMPAALRPHIKVHKSSELARRQVEAGAIGISVATVWEAAVMVVAGLDHVLLVNTLTDPRRMTALAELAREADILVAVDDAASAGRLSSVAHALGATLGVLIEVDTGMGRAGVRGAEEALMLARQLARLPGLELRGLTGYEGHCSMETDAGRRAALQVQAMDEFIEVADALQDAGLPMPILSAGGTVTWEATASHPRVTEIQAGSYVLMDAFHGAAIPDFESALTVSSTIVSTRPDHIVMDAGSKTIGDPDLSQVIGYPGLRVTRFDEEHGIFATSGAGAPANGEVVRLIPGYAPSTVNQFDAYHVIRDGIVIDILPVIPRGPGDHGLVQSLDTSRTNMM